MEVLRQQLDEINRRETLRQARASLPDRLKALADTARTRLADPDEKLMAEPFDLLEIELRLVEPYRFEGTGSIPIPDNPSEVSEEGPRHHCTNLPGLAIRFKLSVESA